MDKYEVSFLDVMAPEVRSVIRQAGEPEFHVTFAESPDPQEQKKLLPNADFIITGTQPMTAEMIGAAARVRLIQKWGIGYDKIDLQAAARAGVPVAITFGANAGPVAEHAIALMLAVYRRLALVDRKIRDGVWLKAEMRSVCYQIAAKTVGIVGFGNIGRMVAHRLRGFDAQLLYTDIRRAHPISELSLAAKYVPLDELLARSDIVTIHAPLDDSTRHLIGPREFERMKRGSILINTARGGIVDEKALYEALVSGKLHGAGLDVHEREPVERSNPLLTLDQVVLAPHTGGGVFDNVEHVAQRCFGNMRLLLQGASLAPDDLIVPPRASAG